MANPTTPTELHDPCLDCEAAEIDPGSGTRCTECWERASEPTGDEGEPPVGERERYEAAWAERQALRRS